MTDLKKTRENPEAQLWEKLGQVKAGMLGLQGSSQHMQPMSPMLEREQNRIIFFAPRDSDLVQEIEAGSRAHFCVVGPGHDYHACLAGPIRTERDPALIDRHWSAMVGAWFDGKDDPNLTLLVMDLADARVWASTDNNMRFGWEILKGIASDQDPDIGVTTEVVFGRAA